MIGLDDLGQTVLLSDIQKAMHDQLLGHVLGRQLAQLKTAVEIQPVQRIPDTAVSEVRFMDIGRPQQVAGQVVDVPRRGVLRRRGGRVQFRVLGQHPPHPTDTDPALALGLVTPLPAQLFGNLAPPPSRMRLFQRTDRSLDLGRCPLGRPLRPGGTIFQADHPDRRIIAAHRAAHPAHRTLQCRRNLTLAQPTLLQFDRRTAIGVISSGTSWHGSTPFASQRKYCQHRLFIGQRTGPRGQTSVPTM